MSEEEDREAEAVAVEEVEGVAMRWSCDRQKDSDTKKSNQKQTIINNKHSIKIHSNKRRTTIIYQSMNRSIVIDRTRQMLD